MAHASEPRFLTLHGLRLKGFGEAPAVAAAVGIHPETVEEHLVELHAAELVLRRDGRLAGWSLTKDGRLEQQRLAAAELADLGLTDVVHGCYKGFLDLNGEMLSLCTDWQLRDGSPNDHADEAHDAAVVERLADLHGTVSPILTELADALHRYTWYAPRLSTALDRLTAGELEYLTKPIIDSYHTVWFELHEDLLSSLGIERSQEGSH